MDLAALEQSVDPSRTLAALGYSDISEPVRITGGWETLIWRFQTADGGDHSLRVYFVPGSHAMARREMIALRTREEAGQPALRMEKSGEHEAARRNPDLCLGADPWRSSRSRGHPPARDLRRAHVRRTRPRPPN
jgi:hypothetical protein